MKRTGLSITTYRPKRGNVLIWHGRLMHQGSLPNIAGMPRRALISHFNSVEHRPDWPNIAWTKEGSAYFSQDIPLDKAEEGHAFQKPWPAKTCTSSYKDAFASGLTNLAPPILWVAIMEI